MEEKMADRNASASSTVPLPQLSRAVRLRARWEGVRDGRRGLPLLPSGLAPDGTLPPAMSAYQSRLQHMANEAALQCRGQLFNDHTRLAAEIFRGAGMVVEQDAAGTCTEAHNGRLRNSLMIWATQAEALRAWVKAAEARANQQLDWYWAAVLRCHTGLREIAAQRQTVLVGQWSRPPAAPGRLAVDDLPDWRPRPIQLDPAWPNPLELLKQWTISRGDADAYQYGVLVRALEILNVPV